MPTSRAPLPASAARSWAQVYAATKDAVFTAALQLTGERAAAEDVVHDVFVAAARTPVAAITSPRAYLLTAVVHRVRDLVRRRGPGVVADVESLPAADAGPESTALLGERAALVAAALQALPLEQREVVVLHSHEDLTFAAIGQLLSVSADTAASRWRYACEKLRRQLAGKGVEP